MSKVNKTFAIILTLIITISCLTLLTVKSASAKSITQPSAPEFTLDFIHAFWLNGTQQYDNNSLIIAITNQHYVGSVNGSTCQIFYDIRIKAHSAQDWQWNDLHPIGTYYEKEFTSYLQEHLASIREDTPVQSNAEYTVVHLTYFNPSLAGTGISFPINTNSTIDIQVKAYVGHSTQGWVAYQLQSPVLGGQFTNVTALDTSSDWSSTKTIEISYDSNSTSPMTSPSPTVPELSWLIILPLLLSVLSVALIVRHRKTDFINQ